MGPVLKDRSRMNSPMGGYAGGLDCSHSQTELGKGPAAKPRRGERLDPDTQHPAAQRQQLAPGRHHPGSLAPTGKNATSERRKCHSGALGPAAKMPLPATADATTARKIPASPSVHSPGPVEGCFAPFQLRNSQGISDRQKCRWRPIPVHPKSIAQGVSSTGARRPPHMNALTGGYAGDSGVSNSDAAMATTPMTQTYTR